jgi:hypothetical protein
MVSLMKKSKLPKTDSIQVLAEFWDTHDLTDFEDELEEVNRPVSSAAPRSKSLSNHARSKPSSKWLKPKVFPEKTSSAPGCCKSSPVGITAAQPHGEADRSRHFGCGL